MSSSTDSLEVAPILVTTAVPRAHPHRSAACTSPPPPPPLPPPVAFHTCRKPALKASPAPVVSTT